MKPLSPLRFGRLVLFVELGKHWRMRGDTKQIRIFLISITVILLIFMIPFLGLQAAEKQNRCNGMIKSFVGGDLKSLILGSSEERYLLGILAETQSGSRFLAFGSYLDSHESLSRKIEEVGGKISAYLWGGELILCNPRSSTSFGVVKSVNETCGLISFLQNQKHRHRLLADGVKIENSNHYWKDMLNGSFKTFQNDQAPARLISWSDHEPAHLHPKLNGFGGNFRHSVLSLLFSLKMIFEDRYLSYPLTPGTLKAIRQVNLAIEIFHDHHPDLEDFSSTIVLHNLLLEGQQLSSDEIDLLSRAYERLRENLLHLEKQISIMQVN